LVKHQVRELKPIQHFDRKSSPTLPVTAASAKKVREQRLGALNKLKSRSRAAITSRPADLPLDNTYVLKLAPGMDVDAAIDDFSTVEEVLFAEPVMAVATQVAPNDPYYNSTGTWLQGLPDLWSLKLLNLSNIWNSYTGSGVVVAVLDSGGDYTHEDLAENHWKNHGEIPGNALDDDGNGYIDDYYGYDFFNGDSDPYDDCGHGTHVAGIVAASRNSVGIVGIAYDARIMSIKAFDSRGTGDTIAIYNGLKYAADNGAHIINCSFAGPGYSYATKLGIDYALAMGCLVVVAAGNDSMDARYVFPANFEGVITVGAMSGFPELYSIPYSNHGPKVDLYAPGGWLGGHDVLSLLSAGSYYQSSKTSYIIGDKYLRLYGTSMAAPHITGIATLLLQRHPDISQEQLRHILREYSNPITSYSHNDFTGRSVNAPLAIGATGPFPELNVFIDAPPPQILLARSLFDEKRTVPSEGNCKRDIIYQLSLGV
jgi:subtilisin family serine protease